MHLKKIHVEDRDQFKDFELDLTYPKGHTKAGKPLDKICIIGDNGTGKTTLLELILEDYKLQASSPKFEGIPGLQYADNGLDFEYFNSTNLKNNIFKLFYSPAGTNTLNLRNLQFGKTIEAVVENPEYKFIHELTVEEVFKQWYGLRANLTHSTTDYLHEKYRELADFLNKKILNKFHLELNPDIDPQKFREMRFIELKTKDGVLLPIEEWSAGIKQLIFTVLPLYHLKPQKGVIMIDEPESSLYPNKQNILIDLYKSICPNMQLIFATHSPILASSFEPWEVVELQFNSNGKVERKLYYEVDNHIDKYNTYPTYLRWDSLFMKLFGVTGESNDARTDMLMELAILSRDLKSTDDETKKRELFKEYEKIAEKLDWATL